MAAAWKAAGLTYMPPLPRLDAQLLTVNNRYNRYLAIAARCVRRSLKEDQRLQAERRGEMDLKFAKWEVSTSVLLLILTVDRRPSRR